MQGVYFSLATSKHGSRSLDALWQSSDIKGRLVIGEELLQKEAALTSNMFGRILSDKYALPLLKKNKADWKTSQEKDNKKRKLFAELIDAPGRCHVVGHIPCICLFQYVSYKKHVSLRTDDQ